ncbi:helix-turn-helix domain-containing protein [Clostridium butyricum]|nr:helix-turn-helix domain-containing protein [Clostridium butyricum]
MSLTIMKVVKIQKTSRNVLVRWKGKRKQMMNQNLENVLLTVNEVAKTLKTNSNTVYELINRGELKGLKLGRIKVPYFEVDRFLRDNLGKEVI